MSDLSTADLLATSQARVNLSSCSLWLLSLVMVTGSASPVTRAEPDPLPTLRRVITWQYCVLSVLTCWWRCRCTPPLRRCWPRVWWGWTLSPGWRSPPCRWGQWGWHRYDSTPPPRPGGRRSLNRLSPGKHTNLTQGRPCKSVSLKSELSSTNLLFCQVCNNEGLGYFNGRRILNIDLDYSWC